MPGGTPRVQDCGVGSGLLVLGFQAGALSLVNAAADVMCLILMAGAAQTLPRQILTRQALQLQVLRALLESQISFALEELLYTIQSQPPPPLQKPKVENWVWWHKPVVLALGILKQENRNRFNASLSYTVWG